MVHPNKRKGDVAEREAAKLIHDLLGHEVKRRHNIGTHEDIGDIIGLPDTTIQVCSLMSNVVAIGVVRKPVEAGLQALQAGTTHAATMLRIRGGTWRFVLTPEQYAALWREATA